MPPKPGNTQHDLRELTLSYINGDIGRIEGGQRVYPKGRGVTARGEDADYAILWLKVPEDKWSFEQRYKDQHGMNKNTVLPPNSIDHLSKQIGFYRHPENPRLLLGIIYVPHDIADEQFDRVVARRCEVLGGGELEFSEPAALNFRIRNAVEKNNF